MRASNGTLSSLSGPVGSPRSMEVKPDGKPSEVRRGSGRDRMFVKAGIFFIFPLMEGSGERRLRVVSSGFSAVLLNCRIALSSI